MPTTPRRSSSLSTSADPAMSRTNSTTSLPASARAMASARPMPRLAPVTTETFPDSENASRTDMDTSWFLSRLGVAPRSTGVDCCLDGSVFRQGQLAMCYQNSGPRQVSLVLGQLDLNAASERVDSIGNRQWRQIPITESSGCRSGDRTGTAGVGLTDAALIDAHTDVVRSKLAYELQVDAVRKLLGRLPAGRCMQLQRVKVVNKAH